jgi:protein tyrosine phosphatase (PTP) superfamily phosphohydrolase (DUF442 family)
MTATLTPPRADLLDPDPPGVAPQRNRPAPPSRRRWRRRLFRLALAFAAVLAIGNLVILAASALARTTAPAPAVDVPDDVAAIRNFEALDETLWRGGAPGPDDLRALAAAGVTTVVDLRAEHDLVIPTDLLDELGLTRVAIPIRDGQTPTEDQVKRFLEAVDQSDGTVYLHCGAGVGRTGTMAAVYSVTRGGGGWDAMRANLAVGPPSLEQLAFAASLDAGERPERPNPALVAVSRTFDAPRRLWKVIEGF